MKMLNFSPQIPNFNENKENHFENIVGQELHKAAHDFIYPKGLVSEMC